MLFNSLTFFLFFPLFFIIYWFFKRENNKLQNVILLFGSYFFYSLWDYRFLMLIIYSTFIDYFIGIKISQSENQQNRKRLLILSIFSNLGVLFLFKYFNFFIESMNILIGTRYLNLDTLHIVLPVGISFYTFQTMSYTIDIYKNQTTPTRDYIAFSAFISFFPQLVAGPIERAKHFLPQFLDTRKFDYQQAKDGLNLILWGFFKKVVIADNLAYLVDDIFLSYSDYNGGILILGAVYFSIQIYCDFSGYSDIAIGLAKLLGFELKSNFKFPYFSKNITSFWRKWHISLSTWFRDYLFIPLGGSRQGFFKTNANLFIVFIISGLWHGANFTFVMWGFVHYLIYLLGSLTAYLQFHLSNKYFERLKVFISGIGTYFLVCIAWIFFRSQNITDGFSYIYHLVSTLNFPPGKLSGLVFISVFLILEILLKGDERKIVFSKNKLINQSVFFLFIFFILSYSINDSEFIYFRF